MKKRMNNEGPGSMRKITKTALSAVACVLFAGIAAFGQTTIENDVFIFVNDITASNRIFSGATIVASNGFLFSGTAPCLTNAAAGGISPSDTQNWAAAYSWMNANSNKVANAVTNGQPNVNLGTNLQMNGNVVLTNETLALSMPTSNWNSAWTWVNSYSGSVATVFANTGSWNTAYSWVNSNSNKVSACVTNGQSNVNFGTNLTVSGNPVLTNSIISITNAVVNGYAIMVSTVNGTNYLGWGNPLRDFPQIRFKAGLATNIALITGANTKLLMTNTIYAATGGSSYSNSLARWYPNTTNKIIRLHGGFNINASTSSQTMDLMLYKNGSMVCDLWDAGARGATTANGTTWTFVDTVNGAGDYYEVYYNVSAAATTIGAGTNNWWYGVVEY